MLDTTQQGIIALLKSALTGVKHPLPEGFMIEKAYNVIKRHRIMSLCYCGAVLCGVDEKTPVMQKLQSQTYAEVIRGECQEWELARIFAKFSEAGVSFLPVKGLFVKKLYREPHMRYMADADVLIKPDEREKAESLLQDLGYRKYAESLCEIIYENDNLHLELHKSLIPPSVKDYYAYFEGAFERAEQVGGSHYKMRDEDHFIYIFVHFARHYRGGGIGLKHLCDLYVCKEKLSLADDYVEGELEKLGLLAFYKNVYRTVEYLFGDGEEDETASLIAESVFHSGAYGTINDMRLSEAARRSGGRGAGRAKRSHFWWVLFLPYGLMCIKYPVLKKAPFLLPFMWVWRALAALFTGNSRAKNELKEVKNLSAEEIKLFRDNLLRVGLDFKF
ncbi:MAG: nucleotidyltransferase family protein [Clostridia bacterium]|nr:nucleotidyltransferase family protein [Clostridia bacterium]